VSGPLETEQQARELPGVRAIFAAFDRDPGPGKMAPHTHKMLISACAAAGVELGDYDRRILLWLSGWEPQTCAVIAGLISRAHAAEDTRRLDAIRGVLDRFDWEHHDRQLALEAIERIVNQEVGQ
jgi:hypothetical protein